MPAPLPIDALELRVLEVALDEPVPMSFAPLTARRCALVTVRSGEHAGTGETWVNHPDWAWRERLATIAGLRPLVLGADASDPPALLDRLAARTAGLARQWGAPGPIWQALSGIDMAAWDLLGRAAGRPVASLLRERSEDRPLARSNARALERSNPHGGGRSAVRAYASGVGPSDVETLTERALELGLGAVKIRVGFGRDTDLATIRGVRAAGGPSLTVFADANQAWDPPQAARAIARLARYGVEWFEEPLAGDDLDALEALAADTGARLATGENVYGASEIARYGSSAALAQIQPDPSKTSGISLAGRAAPTAALSPHCYGGAPTVAASAHLLAAARRPGWLELDVRDNPLRDRIAVGVELDTATGTVRVPDGPGLGLRYDAELVEALTVARDVG